MLFLCWCCDQASDRREYGTSSKVIALKETSKRITEFLPAKKGGGGRGGGRKVLAQESIGSKKLERNSFIRLRCLYYHR